ncbi:MAG: hypothetical protein NTX50_24155 [Candidatus Sumerlaeota bacterium]|nr:hypothetical protein [Candidatus Sumerlaeota bacterium]
MKNQSTANVESGAGMRVSPCSIAAVAAGVILCLGLCALAGAQPPAQREQPAAARSAEGSNAPMIRTASQESPAAWAFLVPEVAGELQLTDEQLEKSKEAIYDARRKAIDLRAKAEAVRLELERLMDSGTDREKDALALVEKIKAIECDLDKLGVSLAFTQMRILTPEQRRNIARLAAQRERMQNMMRREGEARREGGEVKREGEPRREGVAKRDGEVKRAGDPRRDGEAKQGGDVRREGDAKREGDVKRDGEPRREGEARRDG